MKGLLIIAAIIFLQGCKKDPAIVEQSSPIPPVPQVQLQDTVKAAIIGLEIGNKAPSIVLCDTSGNIVSLESIKNKIILIDFWASWCAPCRVENRNLDLTYPLYNDTIFRNAAGFEIFSISTDAVRKMWINYLNNEACSWRYNVRDTSSSISQLYRVNGIPTNFLINEKGIIIAKNLRGSMVEDTLKALLKN